MTRPNARTAGAFLLAPLSLCCALAGCGAPQGFSPPPAHTIGSSGLEVTPSGLSMSPGSAATLLATEQSYEGAFSENDDCSGVVTVSQTGAGSFTVNAAAVGTCSITISDSDGHSQDIPVSIQSVIIGGQ